MYIMLMRSRYTRHQKRHQKVLLFHYGNSSVLAIYIVIVAIKLVSFCLSYHFGMNIMLKICHYGHFGNSLEIPFSTLWHRKYTVRYQRHNP